MCDIAGFYREGKLGQADPEKAFEYYSKAAEAGSMKGMEWLAWCYDSGSGVEKDPVKAFVWYERAAEMGSSYAMYMLGAACKNGSGTEKNEEKAFAWYLAGAEGGHASAYCEAAYCYAHGIGTQQDLAQAAQWYEKAEEAGSIDMHGLEWLGAIYTHHPEVTGPDYERGYAYYQRAAEKGSGYAMYQIGTMYRDGTWLEADEAQARAWFERAAEAGYEHAQEALDALNAPDAEETSAQDAA